MELRLSFIAEAAGGERAGEDVPVAGISFDSRTARAGQLFIPVRGEHSDGHDFVGQAIKGGASAFLWERRRALPKEWADLPHVLVEDSVRALQDSARAWRDRLAPKVVAVTGSNGKTATKEFVAAMAASVFRTTRSPGNANSQIGLPKTILELPSDTQVAVLEMGMSEPGQIARLCRIARPDIGIITMIGEAHLAYLGSRQAIAQAKWELVSSLAPGATAVIPDDEPLFTDLEAPDGVRVVHFGETPAADVRMVSYVPAGIAGGEVALQNGDRFLLRAPGRHQARNALAALAAGDALGVPRKQALAALCAVDMERLHLSVLRLGRHTTLIDDAYNAAPSSMQAALRLLHDTAADVRMAVFGDMAELGPGSERMHEDIGAAASDLDFVFACGHFSASYAAGVRKAAAQSGARAWEAKTWEELVEPLWERICAVEADGRSAAVLVKGSRSAGMERIVAALVQRAAAARTD